MRHSIESVGRNHRCTSVTILRDDIHLVCFMGERIDRVADAEFAITIDDGAKRVGESSVTWTPF